MKKKIIAMILVAAMSCQPVMIYAADADIEFSDGESSLVDESDINDVYSNENNDIIFSDEEEKNNENITSDVIDNGSNQKDFDDGETVEDFSETEIYASSIGDYEYSVNNDGNVTITKYTGKEGSLVIPNAIDGHMVSVIDQYAFNGCKSLTEVEIPCSVTEIGQYAFAYCEKLSNVKLSSGLKNLRYRAFAYCPEITEIKIPKSLEGVDNSFQYTGIKEISFEQGITRIAPGLMQGVTKLTEVVIPEGVTNIGSSAFSGCTGLTKVKIPDGVTEIDQYAFNECKSLPEVEIPDSVTKIGQYAFAYCEKLSKVKLSSGLKNLRYMAFSNCPEITEITIPKSLESVDNSFQYTGIEGISFEQGITRIAPGLMQGATKLIEVVIPEGVTSIGSSAFSGCTGLTKVKIPDSVTEIGAYVFDGCSSLTIYGYTGSCAETYALKNNIPFVSIGEAINVEEYDYSSKLDQWLLDQGTSNAMSYLVKDMNFSNSAAVATFDSDFSLRVTEAWTNMLFRGASGWKEIFTRSTSREQAREILIALLEKTE